MPNRVLFVNHSASRSGAPIVLLRLLRWISCNTNIDFEIVSLAAGALDSEFASLGHPYTSAVATKHPFGFLRRLVATSFATADHERLAAMLKHKRYDLIYSNTITNGYFVDLIRGETPVITHVHELQYWIDKSGPENLARALAHTNHFIAASQAVAVNLTDKHGVASGQLTTVNEFIEIPPDPIFDSVNREQIRQRFNIGDNDWVICCGGVEFWRKGRDLTPQLLALVNRRLDSRQVHLIWVGGEGSHEQQYQLKFDLEKLDIAPLFHLTGIVDNPFDYFSCGDVFALLSRDDSFPLVCLENALLEKPIVCFAGSGGMPEFVANRCGNVVAYIDLDAMADAIVDLLLDNRLRVKLGKQGGKIVREECTVEIAAPRILQLINEVILTSSKH